MLRLTKPDGLLIVGSAALFNSLMRYLYAIAEEKEQSGIDATKWLMVRGIQDAQHYPVENQNFLHIMKSRDLNSLFVPTVSLPAMQRTVVPQKKFPGR